jgi:glycerol kinase
MVERYVMSIDQGTTSTRCILFDRRGRLASVAQREHKQHYPSPAGWSTTPPRSGATSAAGAAGAARRGRITPNRSRRRHRQPARDHVLWDRHTGIPSATRSSGRTPAPTRSSRSCRRGPAPTSRSTAAGSALATYFSAPRIRWLLDHVEGLRERAERGEVLFGTMESWLIWNLTGGVRRLHVTDVTNASRTMLMNMRTLRLGRRAAVVLRRPAGDAARDPPSPRCTAPRAALPGVRIGAALGDQQAALFGQTCFAPGEAKCTYGTGSFLLLNTGTEPLVRSRTGCSPRSATRSATSRPCTRWKGSIASPARWCSGSATSWA